MPSALALPIVAISRASSGWGLAGSSWSMRSVSMPMRMTSTMSWVLLSVPMPMVHPASRRAGYGRYYGSPRRHCGLMGYRDAGLAQEGYFGLIGVAQVRPQQPGAPGNRWRQGRLAGRMPCMRSTVSTSMRLWSRWMV